MKNDRLYKDMNVKTSVNFEIGFADSEIISFESYENSLLIFLKAWNEKLLKFKFSEYILFVILDSWNISDVCEVENSPFLDKALKIVYDQIPPQHPYKLFHFFDDDDNVVVEVCCKDLSISVEIL